MGTLLRQVFIDAITLTALVHARIVQNTCRTGTYPWQGIYKILETDRSRQALEHIVLETKVLSGARHIWEVLALSPRHG